MRRTVALVALAALPVAVLGLFFVLPVAGMLQRGLWPDGFADGFLGGFDPGGAWEVLTRARTRRVVWFTLWTSGVATVVAVLLGLPAAYALHRLDFPGRGALRAALLVPFVLPTVVVGVAFRQLLREGGPLGWLGLDQTPVAILLGLVFFNVAVVIRTVGATWEGLDRRPAEAAGVLGAAPWRVFLTVTLPALRPAIAAAASVVFLFCATAFGVVLTLGGVRYASVETEVYLLTTVLYDLPGAAALSILQLLAVVALLAVAARLRRTADPTAQRAVARAARPRVADLPQLAATALLLAFVAAPVATLVTESLRVDDAWSLGNYDALATRGAGGVLVVPATTALRNSLQTAVDATWISLLLGLLVAVVVTRRTRSRAERRVRGALDTFFMLPLGVSAVTLGFGMLVTLGREPLDLRTWPLLVPVGQALVALPLVVRTLVPVLDAIDDRQRQAAASLGAGPWRTALTVDVPAVARPLVAAAGFAFAVSLGEFGATSFLARDDHPTLPVTIVRLLGRPGEQNYGMALAAACVLALVTALVVLAVERLRVPALGAW